MPTDVLGELVSLRLAAMQPRSRAYYRVQATRGLTAGKPLDDAVPKPAALSSATKKFGSLMHLDIETFAQGHASSSITSARGALVGGRQSYMLLDESTELGLAGGSFNGGSRQNGGQGCGARAGSMQAQQKSMEAMSPRSAKKARTPAVLEFTCRMYSVLESVGTATLMVRRTGNVNCKCFVKFRTVDGTATAGEDYHAATGELEFGVGQTQATIDIGIIDDNLFEQNEHFDVELYDPRTDFYATSCDLGANDRVAVTIIDDDYPGVFTFAEHDVSVLESKGFVNLTVERLHGSTGIVSCDYKTVDQTAVAGADYEHCEGTLVFEHGEARKMIQVRIIDDELFEKSEEFKVVITNPTGGATFPADHNGMPQDRQTSAVTILNDDAVAHNEGLASLMQALNINHHQHAVGASNWAEQFSEAMMVEGGDPEGGEPPNCVDYTLHYLSLPWKVLFAVIPPTLFYGGKLTFVIALIFIGLVTAVIGDVASLFGCVIGLPDSITAITLVALGTSLPDTFASKAAALADPTADAAVGNVTGSNAVNVFLGLGLPWLIGAIYWSQKGATAEWISRYPELYKQYPGGGFAVPAGDLVFSVSVFCGCALVCLSTLSLRRLVYGAELGGPPVAKWATGLLFTGLWGTYIGLSCWQTFASHKA